MAVRRDTLAAAFVLAGQLAGIIGLPLPEVVACPAEAPVTEKVERSCCCACGSGCGPCCCCAKGSEPADPEQSVPMSWHWVGSVQVQKCFATGPAGLSHLPPGLPVL